MNSHREIIAINEENDIVIARSKAREQARTLGYSVLECVKIATAVSELARNIFLYAGCGTITVGLARQGEAVRGIEIVAEDQGPGVGDIELVMKDGYSTSDGLGLGLPGTRRLMDEFEIESSQGKGTRVTIRMWLAQTA